MFYSLILVALGFTSGLLLSLGLIANAERFGCVDYPDHGRKCHGQPTARTGGLALWTILVLVQCTGWLPWPLHGTDWLGIHAMAFLGALDDRYTFKSRYKSLAGLAVAVLLALPAASLLAQTVEQVRFLHLTLPTRPVVTLPFLVLWYWSIPQAINLVDGINGLAMGFSLLVLGALAWHSGALPMLVGGALVATLVLNFPRAKHFLGDCGSLMLGTLLAVLSVRLLVPGDASLPVWVFAYPIADVSLVVAIRGWNRTPLGVGDRSHLHHWMMDRLGGRAWVATPILLAFAALPMLRATRAPGAATLSTLGVIALAGLGLKAFLDRVHPGLARSPAPLAREAALVPRPAPPAESTGSQRLV